MTDVTEERHSALTRRLDAARSTTELLAAILGIVAQVVAAVTVLRGCAKRHIAIQRLTDYEL